MQYLQKFFNFFHSQKETKPAAHQRGQIGEDLAAEFVKSKTTFKILQRNWKQSHHEIDIICKDGNILVFIEVRARDISAKVPGFATLTQKKRASLKRSAHAFLNQLKSRPHTYRFDAIELRMRGQQAEAIHHFRNINVF